MGKREGRIAVFELLFEADFHKDAMPLEIYSRAVEIREVDGGKFCRELYEKCVENLSEIDAALSESSDKRKVSRMSGVTRALLRMGAGEMLYTDVPPKVAINEAVEISKLYNDQKSTAFINGVLNKVARSAGKITDGE